MSIDLDLSRELTRLVQETEGVTDVYAAGSLGTVISLSAVNAVSDSADDAKVAVARSTERVDIHANICVNSSHSVPVTLRAVSDVIATYLNTVGSAEPAFISVKASRIE
ncbi:hypothetical protein [Glaciihabitans sp. UYNi722]|uniref:hypothetical protein n=1 Tax=Glaciihabitans sp. UYNi722 TaxID=3156344 RepID=UPI003392A7A6